MYDSASMSRLFWFQHTTQVTIAATDKSTLGSEKERIIFFYVLLTVRLSIFILVINQLDAQNFCFTISFFHVSTCFEHLVLIIRKSELYYIESGIMKPISGRPVHGTATYRFDDTRGCIIQILTS